jgi:SNF2 family DNA or RNA helicase
MKGLNFLVPSLYENRNTIILNEMEFGETLQRIIFLKYLKEKQGIRDPVLIGGLFSAISHWSREVGNKEIETCFRF